MKREIKLVADELVNSLIGTPHVDQPEIIGPICQVFRRLHLVKLEIQWGPPQELEALTFKYTATKKLKTLARQSEASQNGDNDNNDDDNNDDNNNNNDNDNDNDNNNDDEEDVRRAEKRKRSKR